jgi:hypothetical protein
VIIDSVDLVKGIRRHESRGLLALLVLLLLVSVYLTVGIIIGTFGWTVLKVEYPS